MQEVRSPEQAGGCSLLHLAPPGSGPGWLARQAAGVGGGGRDLRPPARASSSVGARFTRGRASVLRERPGARPNSTRDAAVFQAA